MKRFIKTIAFFFVVPITILLVGIFVGTNIFNKSGLTIPILSQLKPISLRSVTSISSITPSSRVESSKAKKWQQITSDKRYIACNQSVKEIKAKLPELQIKYAQILEKEIRNESLNSKDKYIKYLYGLLQARSKDYSLFEDLKVSEIPSTNLVDLLTNLLDYIYCPQVSKITTNYPTDPASCTEVSLTWMAPFEVPNQRSFQLPQEYELEKRRYIKQLQSSEQHARDCCTGKVDGGSVPNTCTRFRSWMQE